MLLAAAQAFSEPRSTSLHAQVWRRVQEWGARARDTSMACASSLGSTGSMIVHTPGTRLNASLARVDRGTVDRGAVDLSSPAAVQTLSVLFILMLLNMCNFWIHVLWRWMVPAPLPKSTVQLLFQHVDAVLQVVSSTAAQLAQQWLGITWSLSSSGSFTMHITAEGVVLLSRGALLVGFALLCLAVAGLVSNRRRWTHSVSRSNDPHHSAAHVKTHIKHQAQPTARWGVFGKPVAAKLAHVVVSNPTSLSLMAAS
jgi:hypothetical protein